MSENTEQIVNEYVPPVSSLEILYNELNLRRRDPVEAYDILLSDFEGSRHLKGSETLYHNLSVEFSNQDYSLYAAQTADIGVFFYPLSTTLLADKIKYYEELGNTEKCREGLKQLEKVSKKYWEWRTYVFVIDYLRDARISLSKEDEYEDLLNEADKIIQEFKINIPHDERSYVGKAELLLLQCKYDEAIKELEDAVKNVKVAPQSCLKLADLYLERGEYALVVKTARTGITALLQDHPTASTAYMYYVLALALDALRQQNRLTGQPVSREEIQEIYRAYQTADKLFMVEGRASVNYRRTIEARITILCMEENLQPPEKTDDSIDRSSLDQLAELLRNSEQE